MSVNDDLNGVLAPAVRSETMPPDLINCIKEVESRALAWINKNLEFFDPSKSNDNEEALLARKALLELAILVACRFRLDKKPIETEYLILLSFLEEVTSKPSYFHLVARDQRNFLLYALTYGALKACNLNRPEWDWIFNQIVAVRHPLFIERVPYRSLDLLYALSLAGKDVDGLKIDCITPLTLLANSPNVILSDKSDAYALTHAVFYLTDFGLRRSGLTDERTANAIEAIDALAQYYRIHGDADLGAELIASLVCLGSIDTPEVKKTWEFLIRVQDADGWLPGPPGNVNNKNINNNQKSSTYLLWKEVNHTTMVAVLASQITRHAPALEKETRIKNNWSPTQLGTLESDLAEQCEMALAVATEWFIDQTKSPDVSHALQAGAGLALTLRSSNIGSDVVNSLRSLGKRIESLPEYEPLSQICAADTLLFLAYAFQSVSINSEKLSSEVDSLASVIDEDTLKSMPLAIPSCVFLSHLGKIDPALILGISNHFSLHDFKINIGNIDADVAHLLLQASGSDPSQLVSIVEQYPEFRDRSLYNLARSCQDYCLADAAVLLRLCIAQGDYRSRSSRDAVRFLLSQQMPDGSFGYSAKDSIELGFNKFQFSTTFAVAWALMDFTFPNATPSRLYWRSTLLSAG